MNTTRLAAVAAIAAIATTTATAADLGYPTKAAATTAPFNWTGCHIGVHAGAGTGHTRMRDPIPNGDIDATMTGQTANTDTAGGFAGGQFGCDMQFSGHLVAGVEASGAVANITGTNQDQFNFNWTLRSQTDWFGRATARVGFAVDKVLFYGLGGVAFAHKNFEIENANINLGQPSASQIGWTVGAGTEWALASAWSVFLEADYVRLNEKSVLFPGNIPLAGNPPFNVRTRDSVETVRFGVNYRL